MHFSVFVRVEKCKKNVCGYLKHIKILKIYYHAGIFWHLRVHPKKNFQHSIENSLNTARSSTIFYNQRNPTIIVKRKKKISSKF